MADKPILSSTNIPWERFLNIVHSKRWREYPYNEMSDSYFDIKEMYVEELSNRIDDFMNKYPNGWH